jgi:hypothetical protein
MLDYDRYFVLATRYGNMTSVEFSLDSRPGLRYYVKVTDAALKFQRIWDRYWGLIKVRRHVAARHIQKVFRCHNIFSKLYPIIKLRKKFGKRTYYMFAFAMWKQYNRLVKIIRESIKFYRQNRVKVLTHSPNHLLTHSPNHLLTQGLLLGMERMGKTEIR